MSAATKSPTITRDDLRRFIARAIQRAARDGIGVTLDVHVRGDVTSNDYVRFSLDDGSIVAIDPEWLVPRNYGDLMPVYAAREA